MHAQGIQRGSSLHGLSGAHSGNRGAKEGHRDFYIYIYNAIFDEILISTSPGRSSRQAPRMFVSMRKALELLIVESGYTLGGKNWGTLRFSDHRGLRPQDIKIKNNHLDAILSRSKTTGVTKMSPVVRSKVVALF